MNDILYPCHTSLAGGHLGGIQMAVEVLQSVYYWLGLYHNANTFIEAYPQCRMQDNISQKHELPLSIIVKVELFDL